MALSDTLPFPSLDAARPTEAIEAFLHRQAALAGQVWAAQTGTAEFMAERLRKDAALAATLATARMPTQAARLMFGHMQEAWSDYTGQAMRWGTIFTMPRAQADDGASDPVPMTPAIGTAAAAAADAQPPAPAQPRAAGSGKPPRSEPV